MRINAHAASRCAVVILALCAPASANASSLSAQTAPPPGPGAAAGADVIPDQYVVLLAPDADARTEAEDARRAHGLSVLQVYEHGLRGFAFRGSRQAADQLRRGARVQAVSPDRVVHGDGQTIPTGVQRIGATQNPIASIDGIDNRLAVNVAVLDTGIDANHPDLQVVGGTNCMNDLTSPLTDPNGHGTHVAGTVGALDNGLGVVGVAPGVRLWSVRVLDATNSGTASSLVCGIDWVTGTRTDADPTNDIAVANVSLTGSGGDATPCGPSTSDAVHLAICRSVARGVVYAVAAGNAAADARGYFPASFPEVITVGAMTDFNGQPGGGAAATCGTGQDDTFAANYSNWGPAVDIVAPGSCILSTAPGGGTAVMSGTSMATPHVAGAAALYTVSHGIASNQAGVDAVRSALTAPASGWAVRQADARGFSAPNRADACRTPMLWIGPPPASTVHDVSLSLLSGPTSLTVGDAATLTVGVADAGDFGESLVVTLTDGPSGPILDQRSVTLGAGGCASYAVTWNTAGAAPGNHSLVARVASVPGETATADNSQTLSVSVNAQAVIAHVSSATGRATVDARGNMNGIATVALASANGPVANGQITGTFSDGNKFFASATCVTDASGACDLQSGYWSTSSMTFTVTQVVPAAGANFTYDSSANTTSGTTIKHP